MPERLYWVTLFTSHIDGDRQFRIVFACEHTSVAAIAAELKQCGVVSGHRLRIGDDGSGGRLVRGREEFMFGAHSVCSVQVYSHAVSEP